VQISRATSNDLPVDVARVDAVQRINVMVIKWIEALTAHEIGQDHIFAPDHTFGSFHGDEIEGTIRETAHHAWFYETQLFTLEPDQVGPPDYELYVTCEMLLDTSIIAMAVGVSTNTELSREAEDQLYDRIVQAAQAHANGNSAICFFIGSELVTMDEEQLH